MVMLETLKRYLGNGWVEAEETWEPVSVDDPTGVYRVHADVTGKYSVKMRIMFTNNGNTIKGAITKVGTYGGDAAGYTYIAFLHEIDPTDNLALYLMDIGEPITANYYSALTSPYGFPRQKSKFSIKVKSTSNLALSNPTGDTWANPGNLKISLPIGDWDVFYKVQAYGYKVNTGSQILRVTLSTANNSESNDDWTTGGYSAYDAATGKTYDLGTERYMVGEIDITTKADYYLNAKIANGGATSNITFAGAYSPTIIMATLRD